MSLDLAVVRFSGEGQAVDRYAVARDGSTGQFGREPAARWTRDVGFVERHHSGRLLVRGTFAGHYIDVDESDDVSQKGAGEGAASGGLLGVLLGPPGIAVGLLVGGIVGSQLGGSKEHEQEPQALAAGLREAIPPSSSAVVMIAAPDEVDELLAALGDGAEDVIRRTLTDDEVAALEASLSSAPPSG